MNLILDKISSSNIQTTYTVFLLPLLHQNMLQFSQIYELFQKYPSIYYRTSLEFVACTKCVIILRAE